MNKRYKNLLATCGLLVVIGLVFALATAIHWDDPQVPPRQVNVTQSIHRTPSD
jgi:hypothetical protein